MIIQLSEATSNGLLDRLSEMMDGGRIDILSDDQRKLATLKLGSPATKHALAGELVFNKIGEEDAALARGKATSARILSAGGNEVFSCDIGTAASDAVIKLTDVEIRAGGSVRINSFRLAW